MHNIESKASRAGYFVGYACGVWHIIPRRNRTRAYRYDAIHQDSPTVIVARTLRDISRKLDHFSHTGEVI